MELRPGGCGAQTWRVRSSDLGGAQLRPGERAAQTWGARSSDLGSMQLRPGGRTGSASHSLCCHLLPQLVNRVLNG